MALATVGEDGAPDVRYVLVRGVDERGLAFYTNLTSSKAEQLGAHPVAAAAFGWLQLHRQVRVRGRVERVTDAESDAYFASRPRGARVGAWASPQSHVIADREALDALVRAMEARFPGDDVPRPEDWGGFRIAPAGDRVLAGPAEPAPRSPALPPRGRRLGHRAPRAIERAAPGAATGAAPGRCGGLHLAEVDDFAVAGARAVVGHVHRSVLARSRPPVG